MHRPSTSSPSATQGFALVIALSLMAFVLLLLLSITTLVQVESRSSQAQSNITHARANALLALNIALGELQKHAGPDQATTATSDLKSASSTNQVPNPHWTGVWNFSDASAQDTRNLSRLENLRSFVDDKGPQWLVSAADPNNKPLPSYALNQLTDPIEIAQIQIFQKVSDLSPIITSDVPLNYTTQSVQVERFTLSDNDGRIAWWVADEGVKTKVHAAESITSSTGTELQEKLRQGRIPDRPTPEVMAPDLVATHSADSIEYKHVNHDGDLNLLNNNLIPDNIVSRDFTVSSYGLLTNQRKGGLKTDLTAVFEDDNEYTRFLSDTTDVNQDGIYVYGTQQGLTEIEYANGDFHALKGYSNLKWQELFGHYRLYRPHNLNVLKQDSWPDSFSTPTYNSAQYFRNHQNPEDANAIPSFMPRPFFKIGGSTTQFVYEPKIAPILIRWHYNLSISSYPTTEDIDGTPTERYYYRIHVNPIFVLWNPFNVEISAFRNRIDTNLGTNSSIVIATREAGSLDAPKVIYKGKFIESSTWSKAINKEAIVLAPGEIRVFGINNDSVVDPIDSSLDLEGISDATLALNDLDPRTISEGYWRDLNEISDGFTQFKTDLKDGKILSNEIDADAEIFVGFDYNRIRANNGKHFIGNPTSSDPLSDPTVSPTGWHQVTDEDASEYQLTDGDYVTDYILANDNKTKVIYVGYNDGLDETNVGTLQQFAQAGFRAKPTIMSPSSSSPIAPYSQWSYDRWDTYDRYQIASSSISMDPNKNGTLDIINYTDDSGNNISLTYWGQSTERADGKTNIAIWDIPRAPLHSIGELMHVTTPYSALYPTYTIGNSYVPPSFTSRANLIDTLTSHNSTDYTIEDRSYITNSVLFDSFFFSSVPSAWREQTQTLTAIDSLVVKRNGTTAFNSKSYQSEDYFFPYGESFSPSATGVSTELPNPRIELYGSPTIAELRQYDTAAAHLRVNGAFNVNSTSVEAWRSLLSGILDTVPIWTSSANSTYTDLSLTNGISRLSVPINSSPGSTPVANDPWTGVRDLTDTNIRDLAEAIVTEVRARGPFLSLSDFVNRRLVFGNTDPLGFSGTLQSAIDATNINATSLAEGETVTKDMKGDGTDADLETNNIVPNSAVGIPGYLLQNDILRHLAPVLSARSDTFIIRGYGETLNSSTGETTATALCQATVQRIPGYVDDSNPTNTLPSDASLTLTNQTFGRRYIITALEWID